MLSLIQYAYSCIQPFAFPTSIHFFCCSKCFRYRFRLLLHNLHLHIYPFRFSWSSSFPVSEFSFSYLLDSETYATFPFLKCSCATKPNLLKCLCKVLLHLRNETRIASLWTWLSTNPEKIYESSAIDHVGYEVQQDHSLSYRL